MHANQKGTPIAIPQKKCAVKIKLKGASLIKFIQTIWTQIITNLIRKNPQSLQFTPTINPLFRNSEIKQNLIQKQTKIPLNRVKFLKDKSKKENKSKHIISTLLYKDLLLEK